jgi:hypothetical protein
MKVSDYFSDNIIPPNIVYDNVGANLNGGQNVNVGADAGAEVNA